jgi:hypothetical protein
MKESAKTNPLKTTTLHHEGKHKCIAKNNYIES